MIHKGIFLREHCTHTYTPLNELKKQRSETIFFFFSSNRELSVTALLPQFTCFPAAYRGLVAPPWYYPSSIIHQVLSSIHNTARKYSTPPYMYIVILPSIDQQDHTQVLRPGAISGLTESQYTAQNKNTSVSNSKCPIHLSIQHKYTIHLNI